MRIRTIKPEFWQDEKIGELSLSARLLFIALWNIADDSGNFAYKPRELKIQTLPYDNIDIEDLVNELCQNSFIIKYEVNNKPYFHIKNFLKHQKINRPSPPIHPQFTEQSVITHGVLTNNSLGKEGRKEGIGKERKGNNNNNNIDSIFVQNLFEEHGLNTGLDFFNKMELLDWRNQNNEPITDKIRYILKTIESEKNENNKNGSGRIKPKNFVKSSTSDEREPTGAELRKLQKRTT